MPSFTQRWFSKYVFISAGLLLISLLLWLYWISVDGITYELLREWYVPFFVFLCNVGGTLIAAVALDKRPQNINHKFWIFSLIGAHLILVALYPALHYLVSA